VTSPKVSRSGWSTSNLLHRLVDEKEGGGNPVQVLQVSRVFGLRESSPIQPLEKSSKTGLFIHHHFPGLIIEVITYYVQLVNDNYTEIKQVFLSKYIEGVLKWEHRCCGNDLIIYLITMRPSVSQSLKQDVEQHKRIEITIASKVWEGWGHTASL